MINENTLSQAIEWSNLICNESQLAKMLYDLEKRNKNTYQYFSTSDVRKACCSNSFNYAVGMTWENTNINFKIINNYFRMEQLSDNVVIFQEVIGRTNIDIIFCATEKDFADQLAWVISNFNFTDVEYAIIDDSPLCVSSYRYYRSKGSSNIQEREKRNG